MNEWQSFRKHRLGGFHFGKNSMIFQERPLINIKLTKNCPQKLSFILSCLPQYYRWQFLDWTTMASESELSTDYYCSIGAIRRLLCHRPLPPPSRYQTPRSQPPTLCDIVISGCSKYHAPFFWWLCYRILFFEIQLNLSNFRSIDSIASLFFPKVVCFKYQPNVVNFWKWKLLVDELNQPWV